MSAFIVSSAHINAMLRCANRDVCWRDAQGAWWTFTPVAASAIGAMLLHECIASVQHRYPDVPVDKLPGAIAEHWEPYRYTPLGRVPTPVQGLKLIDCYEYQSCEHPGWLESEAYRFCQALHANLIRRLPGYEEAPWEWQEG